MKIVHFSDTHLGFSDLDVVNNAGINQREADFYRAFSDIVDSALSLKPDFIIHTGDLFHRASPSNRAITFALKEFKRIEKAKIPVVIIAGNHSTPKTFNSLAILAALDTFENVHAVYKQRYEKVEFDKVIFHALPHINDEKIILKELDKIESSVDKKKKNILMMHCCVGAHYLMHEFGEWVYPKEREYLFEVMDYVALGHWHGFGAVGNYKNVYYSGSSERTSSGDKRDDKGFVVVDLKDSLQVKHHRINIRKSLFFEIDARKLEEELSQLDLSDINDAMVEVKLFNLTAESSIDIADKTLKEFFSKAMSIKIKREFIIENGDEIDANVEASSLESLFLLHIKERVKDEKSLKRLNDKAKELFARTKESDDDIN